MNRVYCCYPGGKFKALTMSYDDGQIHDRRLVEIFNRHGIKGTFHLNSGLLKRIPGVSFLKRWLSCTKGTRWPATP